MFINLCLGDRALAAYLSKTSFSELRHQLRLGVFLEGHHGSRRDTAYQTSLSAAVLEIALTEVKKQGLLPYLRSIGQSVSYADWEKGLDKVVWPSIWSIEAEIEVASRIAGAVGLR